MVRNGNTVETLQGLFSWAQFVHRQSGSDMEQQVQSSSNTWSSKSSTSCQGSNKKIRCVQICQKYSTSWDSPSRPRCEPLGTGWTQATAEWKWPRGGAKAKRERSLLAALNPWTAVHEALTGSDGHHGLIWESSILPGKLCTQVTAVHAFWNYEISCSSLPEVKVRSFLSMLIFLSANIAGVYLFLVPLLAWIERQPVSAHRNVSKVWDQTIIDSAID